MKHILAILLACLCAGCATYKPPVVIHPASCWWNYGGCSNGCLAHNQPNPPPLPPMPPGFVMAHTFAKKQQPKAVVLPPAVPQDMIPIKGGSLPDIGNGQITVSSFYIGKYEVTWAEWQTVRTWAATNGYDIGTAGAGSATNHPVRKVSWYDVVKWCNARNQMEGRAPGNGYRLPTGSEWEFAARGGTQSRGYDYSGSNDLNAVAWCGINDSPDGTKAVGTKAPNELGLYDMSGNVWEWCSDWHPFYVGKYRLLRGGSWVSTTAECQVDSRLASDPALWDWSFGFRAALPTNPKLSIAQVGANIVLTWTDPFGEWGLERRGTNTWCSSPATVPNEGAGLFRLRRVN